MPAKLKTTTVLLLAICIGVTGLSTLGRHSPNQALAEELPQNAPNTNDKTIGKSSTTVALIDRQQDTRTAEKATTDTKQESIPENGSVEISGRVLDPEGKPVGGCTIVVLKGDKEQKQAAVQTTGPDGQFQLQAMWDYPRQRLWVMAAAKGKGCGIDWIELNSRSKTNEITLQLTKDDIPITGRIVDLEGKPVSGATIRLFKIAKAVEQVPSLSKMNAMAKPAAGVEPRVVDASKAKNDNLISWVKSNVEALANQPFVHEMGLSQIPPPIGMVAPATTDKEGRFRLAGTGIGEERAVVLDVAGPGIERRLIWVVTLRQPPKELTKAVGIYGPTFEHQVGPAKSATGTVTDKTTGKPLAGIRILGSVPRLGYAHGLVIEAITDNAGHYKLDGLPKSDDYTITVDSLSELTYLAQETV
jgi:hypothetical protein